MAIPSIKVSAAMGGGSLVEDTAENGKPYHSQRSWILNDLKAKPSDRRIIHVEGNSIMPTLHAGDVVLVDLARRKPTLPGIFILFDSMELVAKRLEHIPNYEPPKVRVIYENTFYRVYECPPNEINIDRPVRWFAWET